MKDKKIVYFYYISKTKVDMLLSQVRRKRFNIPTISPKVEIAGFGIGLDVKSEANDDLVRKALSLEQHLEKASQVESLDKCSDLNSEGFYHDVSFWRSGLFSFGGTYAGSAKFVTYFLWRLHADSIILLVGSPSNILGEKIVREGIIVPGSNDALFNVFEFVETSIKADEDCLVANFPARHYLDLDVPECKLDFKAIEKEEEKLYTSDPSSLAIFFVRHLQTLPRTQIATLFKVFKTFEIPRDKLKQNDLDDSIGSTNLSSCKRIYVGSPIYTALG